MPRRKSYSSSTDTPKPKGKDAQLIETAKARFKLGEDADTKQRERELEALRMYAGDQWPDDVKAARKGQAASGNIPSVPARPCITVNRFLEPVAQVLNQERQSDLSVELVPADDFGGLAQPINPQEIELREGLIRRIQRESESADARTWAFARAVIAGRGYYAITTRYAEGKTWDQEIVCRRIYNQNGVMLDPNHEQPDGSDAKWGFIFSDLPYKDYCDEYPTAKDKENALIDVSDTQWRTLGDQAPGWFATEGDERMVRVAEYWYIESESRDLCELLDGTSVWKDELPEGLPEDAVIDTRAVVTKKVKWCKLDGIQVLEETDWLSPFIPIIKIVGNEMPPYDGERRTQGMVEPGIGAQRGSNYMISKWVEMVGLAPVPPFMVAEGQIEGYEPFYNQANTRAFPYLPYKTRDLEGNIVGAPQRTDVSLPIAPIAASVQMFNEAIQTTTGVNDPNLGKTDPSLRSGRAILAIQQQGQRGTSNYMDNFTRSVRHEGRIMNSLLYPIYGRRPGRLARIVNGQDEPETVVIGQPFAMQPMGNNGKMVPAPAMPGQPGSREYKLTENANFNVAIKVSKNYDTRRQQEAEMNAELITANPALMGVGGDIFFKSQDGPGAREWSERMRVMLDPRVLAMLEQKKGTQEPIPAEALQRMQQMQMQLQQVSQAAQQMQQELQSQSFKVQSDERIAMAKLQVEQAIAAAKLENERIIAGAKMEQEQKTALEREAAAFQREQLKGAQKIQQEVVKAELAPPPPEPAMEQPNA